MCAPQEAWGCTRWAYKAWLTCVLHLLLVLSDTLRTLFCSIEHYVCPTGGLGLYKVGPQSMAHIRVTPVAESMAVGLTTF
jgi:hypothetical protein